MTWIRKNHSCRSPDITRATQLGDLWACEECEYVWKVVNGFSYGHSLRIRRLSKFMSNYYRKKLT